MARKSDPSAEKEKNFRADNEKNRQSMTDHSSHKDYKDKKGKMKEEKPKKERKSRTAESTLHQVMPIVMAALAAFIGICLYTGVQMGFIGDLIRGLFMGLFGWASYLIPLLILLLAIRWQANVKKGLLARSVLFSFFVIFLISVLCYTFGMPDEHLSDFARFYPLGQAGIGGGFLGDITGFALHFAVSKVGTIIVVTALMIVFLVLGFGIRPKALFLRFYRFITQKLKARREKRQSARDARDMEELHRRNEKAHSETNFYDEHALTPRPAADPSRMTQAQAPYGAAREGERKQVVRRFFDADAEEEAIVSTGAETPASASANRENARASVFRTENSERMFAKTQKDIRPEKETMPAEEGHAEQPLEIQIVSSRPIPANNAVPFGEKREDVPVAQNASAAGVPASEQSLAAEEDLAVNAANADPKSSLVINRAHVVEHIGAETLAEDGEKKYASDTFFYSFPPLSLLREDDAFNKEDSDQEIEAKADKLRETFRAFGVAAKITCITRGPRLTRYEVVPDAGVRISKVENLVDEITMNLEATSVRIEAPIPGKAAIGVEVPNINTTTVRLRGLLDTDTFRDAPGKTTVCLGVDVVGVPVFADLDKMPHLLVAGATGMGKSVCINSLLISLLYKARPDEVKLILIDPKKVEFQSYANIPHLLVPVVTEPQKAAGALAWAVGEMERRYDLIESASVRNIVAYNKTVADHPGRTRLPQIVIVIDELHDLMIQARDAVEDSIARIAAKARAAGILLIIGTQRPSVNVITGVIKANIPSRIAFHVASQVDSRTILDAVGAEKLLNNGDMLFLSPGMKMMTPKRVQGAFLDDDEVSRVADYLRKNSSAVQYDETIMYDMERESERYNKDKKQSDGGAEGEPFEGGEDELFYHAIEIALENGKIATSLLQRRLSVGYGKAARIIDRMFDMGIVGPPNGQKPRDVLMTPDEYREMRLRNDE